MKAQAGLPGWLRRSLKKNNPDAELLDQSRQLKASQEPALKAELVASKPAKAEVTAKPIVIEAEEVLRLVMARQDELQLQSRQTAEEEEREEAVQLVTRPKRRADQPVITELQPRFEKPPNENRSPQPKLAVKVEGSINQDALPEISSHSPAKISGVLLEEKPAELTVVSDKDKEYKPVTPVTEITSMRQIVYEYGHNPPEVTVTTADTEILPVEETMSPATSLAEADFLGDDEIIFDDEVITAFERLAVLINLQQEETPLAIPELYEAFTQGEVVFLNQETTESIELSETNAFEEFIMTKPKPELSPDIGTIIADASDKTLEETLAQLSFYLTEAAQDSESTGIETVLKKVVESLPRSNISYADKENKVAITPELTSKLFILLRSAGYDNPQEVLVEFLSRHNFEFLLQAIRYLYQLIDINNRQELLPGKTLNFTAMKIDVPLIIRLGQAIMHYFFMHKVMPEL